MSFMCVVADVCVKFARRVSEAQCIKFALKISKNIKMKRAPPELVKHNKKISINVCHVCTLVHLPAARTVLSRGRLCLSTVLLLMYVSSSPLKLVKI